MSKKLALVLCGYHYIEGCPSMYFKKGRLVDYTVSIDNYKKYIFDYFNSLDYKIDVFISSYHSKKENKLLDDYKPVAYKLIDPITNWSSGFKYRSKNKILIDGIKLVLNHKENYDNVLITRFDIIFMKDFSSCNINLNKFLLVSTCVRKKEEIMVDDNFYLFPYKIINLFLNIMQNTIHIQGEYKHKYFKELDIDYILDEGPIEIHRLTFFKIIRQDNDTKKIYLLYPQKIVPIENVIKK